MLFSQSLIGWVDEASRVKRKKYIGKEERCQIIARGVEAQLFESNKCKWEQYNLKREMCEINYQVR